MASTSRSFSKLASNLDNSGKLLSTGISTSVDTSGISIYDSAGELPTRGLKNGDQAFAGNRLFISNGSGWYNAGLVNITPSIIDGVSDSSPYTLDSAGGTAVSLSLIANDSDGTPIIWSYIASDSANDLATITNDSNGTFTVIGKSLADILAAGYDSTGGSFTLTFKASDGIAFDTDSASFSLTYRVGPDWTSITEQAKLIASDPTASAIFGWSAEIDGDTVVVGAYNINSAAGAAYVYTRTGSTWSFQQKLVGSDTNSGDEFGRDVAISGDIIVIGAKNNDTTSSNAGAAYVFTRSGSTWTQQQRLIGSDTVSNDFFGICVDIDNNTIAVGASGVDAGGTNAGAVYVFVTSDGGSTWTQQQKIQASTIQANAGFGFTALSIQNDTLVVGSGSYDTASYANAGAVYIFTRSGSTWTQQQLIESPNAQANTNFGYSIGLDGDTIVVGSVGYDLVPNSVTDIGRAHVYTRTGSTWSLEAQIQPADLQAGDNFGGGVAISDNTIVIGSPFDDDTASNAGTLYVYTREGTTWTQVAKLQSSDVAASWRLGYGVGISNDTIVGGAYYADTFGAAYIFVAG